MLVPMVLGLLLEGGRPCPAFAVPLDECVRAGCVGCVGGVGGAGS